MLTHISPITHIKENEVFVFGANAKGFHGAGSAGFASFRVFGNKWRNYNYHLKPKDWQGKWNKKGIVNQLTKGTHGWGYGLVTVEYPGKKDLYTQTE